MGRKLKQLSMPEKKTSKRKDPKCLLAYQRRYRRAKAILEEIKLSAQRGEIIKRVDVQALVLVAGQSLQNGVRELVARLPEQLHGRDIKQIGIVLEHEFRRLLEQHAENMRKAETAKSEIK